jgi:hypothetical protein
LKRCDDASAQFDRLLSLWRELVAAIGGHGSVLTATATQQAPTDSPADLPVFRAFSSAFITIRCGENRYLPSSD